MTAAENRRRIDLARTGEGRYPVRYEDPALEPAVDASEMDGAPPVRGWPVGRRRAEMHRFPRGVRIA